MKTSKVLVCAICAFALLLPCGERVAHADDEPYIKRIDFATGPTFGIRVGFGGLILGAVVRMSDGTVARSDNDPDNAVVTWSLSRVDGRPCDNCTLSEGSFWTSDTMAHCDGADGSAYVNLKGCSTTLFVVPYGEPEGFYVITATSVADPDAVGEYRVLVRSEGAGRDTFYRYRPGEVAVGKVMGSTAAAAESYDKASGSYSTVLPACSFKSAYYRFSGWLGEDGSVHRPGERLTRPIGRGNFIFTATWEPRFSAPVLVRAQRKGAALRVRWRRVVGADGYIVWRAAPGGRYRKVKVLRGSTATSWIDSSVAAGRVYRYRVAAWRKKGAGRQVTRKSCRVRAAAAGGARANAAWVGTSTTGVLGKVGSARRLKATVSGDGGPLVSRAVRWYSSDKRVASVGRKTGRVSFKARGTCEVWAKAHNGVNSAKVRVTVR